MKKFLRIFCIFIFSFLLGACGKSVFDGSRTGNDSQFMMEYQIFHTTDSQDLLLEPGDMIRTEIVAESGKLSVKIQKASDKPVYENDNITASGNFDVEIQEGGTYMVSVTGEKAKGSISFIKIPGEGAVKAETQQEVIVHKETLATQKWVDFSEVFQGINGCAVIYSPSQEQFTFYNEDLCRQEKSPYSTFKIVSALSGLKNHVIDDETSQLGYDGTVYSNPEWNGDLTLKEAFQKSCIWYFRKIVDSVGKYEIQQELNHLQYGNCDISEWDGSHINPMEKLNGFWLDSSLKISPLEQVNVLVKIFEGQSMYDNRHIEILKSMMLVSENGAQGIYGKTGSGNGEAWFIGFSELDSEREYFAIYLDDYVEKDLVSGKMAKEIALEILRYE